MPDEASSDTTDRLLDAVDAVIAEHGPSGVTLRRVGAGAGLSHTAAAHYYRDKTGLFTAFIIRAWERVADRLAEAAAIEDPLEAMRAAARCYARFAVDEASSFSVMNRLELVDVDTPELWAARERGYFTLFAIIERAQGVGYGTGRETMDLLATTWAFVHGFVDLWVGGPLAAPYDGNELTDTLDRLLLSVLDGL